MRFGVFSGLLWGLDTVVLGIALAMSPFSDPTQTASIVSIASAFLHDALCAAWLVVYMGARKRLGATLKALKTRSGLVVMAGALLGGPIGMTGYLIAINNIGPGYTAIISACYPALGALLSYVFLKERMNKGQVGALLVALAGVMAVGFISSSDTKLANPVLGLVGALLAVAGWGSEGVLCAWGMRDDAVDNDTALQIRETTSALAYAIIALPLFGAWKFTANAIPHLSSAVILLAALAGTASYLCYYKGIEVIGTARAMALNISYSAWAVVFGFILQGTVPSAATALLCLLILCSTVLAASDWNELFYADKTNKKIK
ncbi:DMT family transporter [Bifidobacterium sp. ESL0682]|uniref:DMT family transporter n=1 Tax=Bifidobacterium sp. ESL0682 TaxID=2983212 RepID=UPI0023F66C62|nr:DMT family transporter [Bifidobacterium sp. ESL0682]WEV42236.1 DMT family transporter [Bifidobacterium sp. ESL0682]